MIFALKKVYLSVSQRHARQSICLLCSVYGLIFEGETAREDTEGKLTFFLIFKESIEMNINDVCHFVYEMNIALTEAEMNNIQIN